MNRPTVGFLDSGVGGIPYLIEMRTRLPDAHYLYYADTAHFPYGERSVDELRAIVVTAVAELIEFCEPDVVVVACNTASVVALAELRHRFDRPFVGVVPAIKPAASVVGDRPIGVLATSRTVEDPYVAGLLERFARGNDAVLVAAGGLVQLIEEGLATLDEERLTVVLAGPVEQLKLAGVGAVVLGCTHFIHVRDTIARMLGPGIVVVDSVDGVVRQTLRVVDALEPRVDAHRRLPGAGTLYVSDPSRGRNTYEWIARTHALHLLARDADEIQEEPR